MSLAELHTMAGVWALGALDEAESAVFEQHLRECESCAVEAAELRETTARLSVLVEVAPPPHLRERVLAVAAKTRQQPPEMPAPVVALRPKRQWARRTAVFVAAAAVLGAVGVGVQSNLRLSNEVDELRQVAAQYEQLNALMSAPGAKTVSRVSPTGGTGMAVYSPGHNKVLFLAAGLPALPPDRSYQLWMVDGSGPHSVALLDGVEKPMVMDLVPGLDKLALTVEPRGGSEGPTTPAIVSLPYA